VMELLDAMCSMEQAKSVVEYSLASCFRRSYSTIFKALDEMKLEEMWLAQRLVDYLPRWPLLVADSRSDAPASALCAYDENSYSPRRYSR
jgi:hypothetical protein